jgi:hypothetical protein
VWKRSIAITNKDRTDKHNLPIRFNLRLAYILSLLIATLVALSSLGGIRYQAIIYPNQELVQSFLATDVVNLFIGLPVLLVSMWLAWRGKLIGLLFWPGAILYVVYINIIYVLGMPFNLGFVLHLVMLAMAVYTLIGLVASIDGRKIQGQLSGAVPERLAGGILAGLGVGFFLLVIGEFANAYASRTVIPETELALLTADFLISPPWVIGGVLLWRCKELGYVTGLGLLYQATMLFLGLIFFIILQPYLTSAPFVLTDLVVILFISMIILIPLALFGRGVVSVRSSTTG